MIRLKYARLSKHIHRKTNITQKTVQRTFDWKKNFFLYIDPQRHITQNLMGLRWIIESARNLHISFWTNCLCMTCRDLLTRIERNVIFGHSVIRQSGVVKQVASPPQGPTQYVWVTRVIKFLHWSCSPRLTFPAPRRIGSE